MIRSTFIPLIAVGALSACSAATGVVSAGAGLVSAGVGAVTAPFTTTVAGNRVETKTVTLDYNLAANTHETAKERAKGMCGDWDVLSTGEPQLVDASASLDQKPDEVMYRLSTQCKATYSPEGERIPNE